MSWTKKQFIIGAYEELGLASYTFDIQPEEYETALRRLDAMMADWNVRGIRLGYPIPSTPAGSSITDLTSVPDSANEAVVANLSLKIAPTLGKQVTRELKVTAKSALNTQLMRSGVTDPIEKQLPRTMPRGAGHKTYREGSDPFMTPPLDPVDAGSDSVLDYN